MQEQNSFTQINSFSMIESMETGGKECRICLQNEIESQEQIRAPCKCEGSVKYVHVNCLKKWILTTLRQKASNEIIELQKQGIPCELCKQKIYFQLDDVFGCRECSEVCKKIKYNLKTFIPLLTAVISFFIGCVVCLLLSNDFSSNTSMQLIVLCLAGILGLSGLLLLFYLFFEFSIYQDIEVKNIQTIVFQRKRILGNTTDNWKKNRDLRIHVENIE